MASVWLPKERSSSGCLVRLSVIQEEVLFAFILKAPNDISFPKKTRVSHRELNKIGCLFNVGIGRGHQAHKDQSPANEGTQALVIPTTRYLVDNLKMSNGIGRENKDSRTINLSSK